MEELDKNQNERALMREKFLGVLKYMTNKRVELQTYKGARVHGELRSVDYHFTNFHVHNLTTPIGVVPEALVRSSDVVTLKLCLDNLK